MPTADVSGPQRRVMSASVRPTRSAWGDSGIRLKNGRSLPFAVTRAWLAPVGYYQEAWYLVNPETREVLYEGPSQPRLIYGLQSFTKVSDVVTEPIALTPGRYLIVFALGGLKGGEVEVEASEAPAEEAA